MKDDEEKDYATVKDSIVQLIDGPYVGMTLQYGRVQLIPEGDSLRISFDYKILSAHSVPEDVPAFTKYIGDILTELIYAKLDEQEVVYTGGTD